MAILPRRCCTTSKEIHMKFKKSIGFVLMSAAAAGIAGTGITTTVDPALAKTDPGIANDAKLNTATAATGGGDGLDVSGGANAQMQQAAKSVEQVGDGITKMVDDSKILASGNEALNQSPVQADATVIGAGAQQT